MDKGLLDIGLLLEPIDMEKYEFARVFRLLWKVVFQK